MLLHKILPGKVCHQKVRVEIQGQRQTFYVFLRRMTVNQVDRKLQKYHSLCMWDNIQSYSTEKIYTYVTKKQICQKSDKLNIQIEIIIVLVSLHLKIVNDLGSNSEVITVTAINFVFWHIPVGAFSFVITNSTFELFVLKCSQCFNLLQSLE